MASDYIHNNGLVNQNIADNTLYIYDKANKGFIAIQNYFKSEESADGFDFVQEKGEGEIETLKLGKKDITASITNYGQINTYKADCAAWMQGLGYNNGISQILESGDTEAITKLVNVFSGKGTFPPID